MLYEGFARVAVPERMLHQGPRAGTQFQVTEPDHGFAVLEFESGAHGFIYHSFTVASNIPPYEIHGTKGGFSIQAHDDGRGIRKFTPGTGWEEEPSPPGAFEGLDWGKGIADLANAIRQDCPVYRSAAQARHVLEICDRILESSDTATPVDVISRFPTPVPTAHSSPWTL